MPTADAMLLDFSDSEWHFGLDGAIAMANAYLRPAAAVPLGQRGRSRLPAVQCRPGLIAEPGRNPERIQILAPGEPFELHRLTS
jgi:hypothetical protein